MNICIKSIFNIPKTIFYRKYIYDISVIILYLVQGIILISYNIHICKNLEYLKLNELQIIIFNIKIYVLLYRILIIFKPKYWVEMFMVYVSFS